MNEISTEVKTHVVITYTDKDYYITEKQFDAIMRQSGDGLKGITLNNDYIAFSQIKTIQQYHPEETNFFKDFVKIEAVGKHAYESMLKGFDQAIKERPGTYKLCNENTVKLRKKIANKVESFA